MPIYYFNPIFKFWLINLGVFLTGKKTITNFLNFLNIYRQIKEEEKQRALNYVMKEGIYLNFKQKKKEKKEKEKEKTSHSPIHSPHFTHI